MTDAPEQRPQQASNMYSGQGSRPVPDPTLLTTQQLNREISALKEIVFTRLDGMDKALTVFTDNLTRVPTEVDVKTDGLKNLIYERIERVEEKFNSVSARFGERDLRAMQATSFSQSAVSAALEAAEKAVTKSEIATLKLIDQLSTQIQSQNASLDSQIVDIKGRLIRMEEGRIGQKEAGAVSQTSYSNIVGMVGLLLGAMIGVGSLVLALTKAPEAPHPVAPVVIESPSGALR